MTTRFKIQKGRDSNYRKMVEKWPREQERVERKKTRNEEHCFSINEEPVLILLPGNRIR
jgi:hypothetical protein